MNSSLELQPGSNTTVAVGTASALPPVAKHKMLASLVSAAVGSKLEYLGSHLSSTMWSAGDARPITIRIIPRTDKLDEWYSRMGSPLGNREIEYYALHIDWRGTPRTVSFYSAGLVIPSKAIVVRGAPNYENAGPAELRAKIQSIPTDAIMSKTIGAIDKAIDWAVESVAAAGSAIETAIGEVLEKAPPYLLVGGMIASAIAGAYLVMRFKRS